MQANSPVPPIPRTVTVRKSRSSADKPIIAIDGGQVLTERGEVFAYADLPTLIADEPPSIVVTHQPGHVVRDLDHILSNNPAWQFRATPVEREIWAPNRRYRTTVRDTTIAFFGFRGRNKRAGHYHYPVSPMTFVLKTANELRREADEPNDTLYKLLQWGKDLREYLIRERLELRPTAGGIAGQLLRDKRFYKDARRKVPMHTNKRARDHLPGNYYRLHNAREGVYYKAAYLDQISAHHSAAADLLFPSSDTLRRRGYHSTLRDRPFCKTDSPNYSDLIGQHGLFYLSLEVPRIHRDKFPVPAVKANGDIPAFVYSNELPYVLSLGVRIRYIIAAWTSPDADAGLNLYARWALSQMDDADRLRKQWLKPTLLASYGVLAARPKHVEFGYKRAKGGEEKRYPVGSGYLTVQAKRQKHISEMPTANVIHRGMIEAETRLRSLAIAADLTQSGYSILGIYADSVFVENAEELPFLPYPWRVQDYLTRLRFVSATAFTSAELEKMPGIPLRERNRARLPSRPTATHAAAEPAIVRAA